jgi:hypothetical protein
MNELFLGSVQVLTTNNRTRTAEEIASLALDKILYVSENIPEPLKAQAFAYKDSIRKILTIYIQSAIDEEKTSCITKLQKANYAELADLLRN